jgi:MFS family permease
MIACSPVISLASSPTPPLLAAARHRHLPIGIQGGLAGGALQVMTPNQMRGQVMAVYLFLANLIGLGLGPTVVAAMTDFVFRSDAAIGQSLALAGAVLCPIAALILASGMKAIRSELDSARHWAD